MNVMNKIFLIVLLSILATIDNANAQSQTSGSQYLLNPYVLNDGLLGVEKEKQFFGAFNKQWIGIDGSPATGGLFFEMPVNDAFSIGGKLLNFTDGPFNQTQFFVSAAYALSLDQAGKHKLRTGLSLGVANTNFDITLLTDPGDPAVASLGVNTLGAAASFGLAYCSDKLRVGVSLPNLVTNQVFDDFDEISTTPYDNFIVSTQYVINLSETVELVPNVVYYRTPNLEDQLEVVALVNYDAKVHLGIGYLTGFGGIGVFGMSINNTFAFNYGYRAGFANQFNGVQGSHELVLRVRI